MANIDSFPFRFMSSKKEESPFLKFADKIDQLADYVHGEENSLRFKVSSKIFKYAIKIGSLAYDIFSTINKKNSNSRTSSSEEIKEFFELVKSGIKIAKLHTAIPLAKLPENLINIVKKIHKSRDKTQFLEGTLKLISFSAKLVESPNKVVKLLDVFTTFKTEAMVTFKNCVGPILSYVTLPLSAAGLAAAIHNYRQSRRFLKTIKNKGDVAFIAKFYETQKKSTATLNETQQTAFFKAQEMIALRAAFEDFLLKSQNDQSESPKAIKKTTQELNRLIAQEEALVKEIQAAFESHTKELAAFQESSDFAVISHLDTQKDKILNKHFEHSGDEIKGFLDHTLEKYQKKKNLRLPDSDELAATFLAAQRKNIFMSLEKSLFFAKFSLAINAIEFATSLVFTIVTACVALSPVGAIVYPVIGALIGGGIVGASIALMVEKDREKKAFGHATKIDKQKTNKYAEKAADMAASEVIEELSEKITGNPAEVIEKKNQTKVLFRSFAGELAMHLGKKSGVDISPTPQLTLVLPKKISWTDLAENAAKISKSFEKNAEKTTIAIINSAIEEHIGGRKYRRYVRNMYKKIHKEFSEADKGAYSPEERQELIEKRVRKVSRVLVSRLAKKIAGNLTEEISSEFTQAIDEQLKQGKISKTDHENLSKKFTTKTEKFNKKLKSQMFDRFLFDMEFNEIKKRSEEIFAKTPQEVSKVNAGHFSENDIESKELMEAHVRESYQKISRQFRGKQAMDQLQKARADHVVSYFNKKFTIGNLLETHHH